MCESISLCLIICIASITALISITVIICNTVRRIYCNKQNAINMLHQTNLNDAKKYVFVRNCKTCRYK